MLRRAAALATLVVVVGAMHCALPAVDEYASGNGKSGGNGGDAGGGGGADPDASKQDATGSGTDFQSCAPGGNGMTNCGTGSESCCTSLSVAGGTFWRTYTNTGTGATGVGDQATVSSFRLDKYEVTVGRFRQFVNAVLPAGGKAGWLPAAGAGKHTHLNGGQGLVNSGSTGGYEPGWSASDNGQIAPTSANLACDANYATWTLAPGSRENQPINCVNWWEAYAFCIWDGGFLPSEAEWGYAAAGGSQQRQYPWGTTDPGTGNLYAIFSCYYPTGSGVCSNTSNIAPVGTPAAGAGAWGQLDLVGNMWEWNLDWYGTYASPCADCANLTPGTARVYRGGSFDPVTASLGPSYRVGVTSTSRTADRGIRCARTP